MRGWQQALVIPPMYLMIALVLVLVAVAIVRRRYRHRHASLLLALARKARMNYSPVDRFDLAVQLRRLPAWAAQSPELAVQDVLYASDATVRRFVATASFRRTYDERPQRFVFTCIERIAGDRLETDSIRVVPHGGPTAACYREAVASLNDATA